MNRRLDLLIVSVVSTYNSFSRTIKDLIELFDAILNYENEDIMLWKK